MEEKNQEQTKAQPMPMATCWYVTKELCDEKHKNIALELSNARTDTKAVREKIDKLFYMIITILGGLAVQLLLYAAHWIH